MDPDSRPALDANPPGLLGSDVGRLRLDDMVSSNPYYPADPVAAAFSVTTPCWSESD